MRAVLISVFILSAILFTTLVLYFTLYDSPSEPGFTLKLNNASCMYDNYTGTCKSQDSCASNTMNVMLKPCNEGDPSLVCCPKQKDENVVNILPKRTPGEKAVEMCKIYGKTASRKVKNPALIGPKYFIEPNCEVQRTPINDGGNDAKEKEFPHMVQIGNFLPYDGGQVNWLCGGSLVSPEFILSAAHCPVSAEDSYAMFGSNNIEESSEFYEKHVISISEVHIHPNYNPETNDNDLALYKLSSKLNYSETPICLDTGNFLTNMPVIATGFGFSKERKSMLALQKFDMHIVDQGTCATKYKQIPKDLPKFSVCAYTAGKNLCQGGSGGQIQIPHSEFPCMYTLIGVPSFGVMCSQETTIPDVFTKVSPYLEWIEDIVWPA